MLWHLGLAGPSKRGLGVPGRDCPSQVNEFPGSKHLFYMQIYPEPHLHLPHSHSALGLTFQASILILNHRGVQMPGAPWSPWILFKLAKPNPAYSASPLSSQGRDRKGLHCAPPLSQRPPSLPPCRLSRTVNKNPALPVGLAVTGSSINALNFKMDSSGNTSLLCY